VVAASKPSHLPPAVVGAALGTALIATGFGFLEGHGRHPDLKLGGAMLLAVAGTAIVLAVRYLGATPEATPPGIPRNAESTAPHTSSTVLSTVAPMVAVLSMAAALIHFAVIEQHFAEFALYGAFFIGVGLFQAGSAILALTRPSRLLYVAGLLGNLATVGAWVVTRTVGSLVGPAAHEVAPIGFGDLISTLFEVLIAVGFLVLLRRPWSARHIHVGRSEVIVDVIALAVTVVTILALFSTVGGSPFVSHVG
jgi:hypothetical protein